MRFLAGCHGILVAVLLIGTPSSVRAEICALYMDGTSDCYFSTKAQCMEGIRSRGGSCIERGTSGAKPPEKANVRAKPSANEKGKPAAR